ncbi:MAG: Bifunctional primase/polymerase [Phenylobacterium sp.]|nr:Bifunctional primase/polymerase [Phenylobacterium sp.]
MTSPSPTPFADYVADRERDPSDAKVFPCVRGGKVPATSNGHRGATSDMAQLRAWASENPSYNVGLDPHSIGQCVVDIDGAEGEQNWLNLEIDHELVPPTTVVLTPRGGRHLYFRGLLPTTAGKLAPKIDTRGSGTGYVLIPPSVTADGTYRYE